MSDIKVTIGGDSSGFDKSLKSVKAQANELGNAFGGIGSRIGTALLNPITAAAAAIGGVMALTVKSIRESAQIADEAANLAMGGEAYQRMSQAFEDVGLKSSDAATAIGKLRDAIADANAGNDVAREKFDKLGVNFYALKDLAPEKQFEAVALAIGKLGSETEKSAMASDLFGKSGKRMLQLVNDYASISAEMQDRPVISQETLDNADKLDRNLASINASIRATVSENGLGKMFNYAIERAAKLNRYLETFRGVGWTLFADEKQIEKGENAESASKRIREKQRKERVDEKKKEQEADKYAIRDASRIALEKTRAISEAVSKRAREAEKNAADQEERAEAAKAALDDYRATQAQNKAIDTELSSFFSGVKMDAPQNAVEAAFNAPQFTSLRGIGANMPGGVVTAKPRTDQILETTMQTVKRIADMMRDPNFNSVKME